MPLLQIKNLKKKFDKKNILKGVDLTINKGEVIVIIGPSGSGKTTLLKNINFLEQPTSGEMNFKGHLINLQKLNKQNELLLRRHTAMVFQNYSLFKNKTALENITEGLIYGKKMDKNKANQIALKELNAVNLSDKKDSYPAQLSGGQQQRIGIARATALDPDLILFDEPTSALDPELVGTVIDDIDNLANKGQTMIVVTHLMSFAKRIGTKILFFEDGQIKDSGTPDKIFNHPDNKRVEEFLSAIAQDK
ncbi:arginine ABC transporter ATP-binding protein [Philodulcilactobacillus myokoensis]|uniref:Arginine ABC transporter ATP-binding protein n=1 Tax=Philodulcilactobacillus myokoensis TaxID=2929573 RepID=A0A9W6AZH5_9LACO|nr:amino acid ABC transporter ATP-binding protein [Philodulcilactobacillus myokoensis]GLB46307.1 arginine ABC transporter ATP-binding protein [Philodulcilactobacillus myokoensis]